MVIITDHAEKRFKERLGLPKSACLKHAQIAYDEGFKHEHARGKAKRYLDKLFLEHRNANAMRVYGEFIYLFSNETLVTVLNLPKNLRGGFKQKNVSVA